MINHEDIKKQSESVKKLLNEVNNQNRIFGQMIDSTLKNAPESDKSKINEVKILTMKAINLAKLGRTEEAESLIKTFKNGGQDS